MKGKNIMDTKVDKSFKKSLVMLISGSLMAQIIAVTTSPLLTRIFTSEQVGTYTYILSITTMFMAVINGRYDMSIVAEDSEEDVYAIIKLSLIIGIISTIVITLLCYIYFRTTDNKQVDYIGIYIFIFVLLLTYAINNVLVAYNNRNKEYKIMTQVQIIRCVYQNLGAVLLGLCKIGLIGLLLPYAIGQFKGMKSQSQSIKPYINKIKDVNKKKLKEVLIKHKKQPLYSAPAIFANSFSYSSITLFIEMLFGMASVAYYSISVRILGIPLSIVSGNISKIFFQEASKEYSETGGFYSSFRKTVLFQIFLAIPMVIIMILFAPKVCEIVFGDEWRIAGEYIKILAPMFGIRFIVTSISPGMIIANKQKSELILQLIFITSSIFIFITCKIMNMNISYYLAGISIMYSIGYVYFLIKVYEYSKEYIRN